MSSKKDFANKLIDETSPYLLQHAHNPVDWYPWGKEALDRAKKEDKPIIVSIGYSSCHWCHVMAHESFEDTVIARIMNENYINIKIDREERPDVDQVYMDAVQAMGLRGGWPLNVFLTPDQKPFYGGTYFPKEGWKKLLMEVSRAFKENREKLDESADRLAASLNVSLVSKYGLSDDPDLINKEEFDSAVHKLSERFDRTWGGMDKAPKFPMPSTWKYLLQYYDLSANEEIIDHVLFTLDHIASGGIYDQIGGGFARYSVDAEWHVPHFEKMLYDNGQLVSLYADAFSITQNKAYKEVIMETVSWLKREMTNKDGGFYAALDADSEGEEGKYYVWASDEIKKIASDHYPIIKEYYDISSQGNWEGKNVLRRLHSDEKIESKFSIDHSTLSEIITGFKQDALSIREKRIRPGLDDKIISGWNGLMLSGLLNAYQATEETELLEIAKINAHYIKDNLINKSILLRTSGLPIEGFLEDYGAVIEAFITYYQTSFDEQFLSLAQILTDHVIDEFYDQEEKLFYYTSSNSQELIARKKEIFDNVIPASNSMMGHNLYMLGIIFDNDKYKNLAKDMLGRVSALVTQEPEYMSNWNRLAIMMTQPTPEIIIIGDDAHLFATELNAKFIPNKIVQATLESSNLPLFKHKSTIDSKTTIYVCYNKTCKLPVSNVNDALKQLK